MTTSNLTEFLDTYAPEGSGVEVTTIDLKPSSRENPSPFIVLKFGRYAAVVNPMALGNPDAEGAHLCIDVHPFVDGEDATAGAFGMSKGGRIAFSEGDFGTTSHKWPSAQLVAVLIGEQG